MTAEWCSSSRSCRLIYWSIYTILSTFVAKKIVIYFIKSFRYVHDDEIRLFCWPFLKRIIYGTDKLCFAWSFWSTFVLLFIQIPCLSTYFKMWMNTAFSKILLGLHVKDAIDRRQFHALMALCLNADHLRTSTSLKIRFVIDTSSIWILIQCVFPFASVYECMYVYSSNISSQIKQKKKKGSSHFLVIVRCVGRFRRCLIYWQGLHTDLTSLMIDGLS